MPWLDEVAAVVQAWYPGQEVGNSIADVLLGRVDPGGRLPQTFPARMEDDPAWLNYPGEAGHVRYGEGIFVGYRQARRRGITPLFPFGFGLSYTHVTTGPLRLDAAVLEPGGSVVASLEVTNAGNRPGSTVLQLYVTDVEASVTRPEIELKGFAKATLAPGETRTLSFRLDMRSFAFFDVTRRAWVAEAGRFRLHAGLSERDIVQSAELDLTGTWVGDPAGGGSAA